jgi:hypothetical protein
MDDGRDGVTGDGGWSQGGYTPPAGGSGQDGYYVPPPTRSGDATYPGGQGWQGLSTGEGGAPSGPLPPPPPKRRMGWTALRVVVVIAVVFGGAMWTFLTAADRDQDGSITEAGELDVLALEVGDCFDDPEQGVTEVESIRALPCDQPHDNEVFHEFELPEGAELPSREAIDEQIGTRCLPAFDEFVGIAYEDSALDVFTFEPTAGSWRQGDRTVTCAVYDLSGDKLVGTARGAAR